MIPTNRGNFPEDKVLDLVRRHTFHYFLSFTLANVCQDQSVGKKLIIAESEWVNLLKFVHCF
jgi:hypothetical protein